MQAPLARRGASTNIRVSRQDPDRYVILNRFVPDCVGVNIARYNIGTENTSSKRSAFVFSVPCFMLYLAIFSPTKYRHFKIENHISVDLQCSLCSSPSSCIVSKFC